MKYLILIIVLFFLFIETLYCQSTDTPIKEMTWGEDSDLQIEMENDTNYVYNIKALYHYNSGNFNNQSNEFTYYPVKIGSDFIADLKAKKIDLESIDTSNTQNAIKAVTLWSAMHSSIGGGWVHFMNCVMFSLETDQLDVFAPLMMRPELKWKPNPMTESYKRTRKWEYYVPVNQKYAKKEYRIKRKKGELGNLEALPPDLQNFFLKHLIGNIKNINQTMKPILLLKST